MVSILIALQCGSFSVVLSVLKLNCTAVLPKIPHSSKSASTTPQRTIWNSLATVGVRDFWENGCRQQQFETHPVAGYPAPWITRERFSGALLDHGRNALTLGNSIEHEVSRSRHSSAAPRRLTMKPHSSHPPWLVADSQAPLASSLEFDYRAAYQSSIS